MDIKGGPDSYSIIVTKRVLFATVGHVKRRHILPIYTLRTIECSR